MQKPARRLYVSTTIQPQGGLRCGEHPRARPNRQVGERHALKQIALAASLAGLALAASASPATASVTIGQVGSPAACSPGFDWVQPTVTSGNSYVVPSTGGVVSWTVKSWTTYGGAAGAFMTMKIWRKVADPATYRAVGLFDEVRKAGHSRSKWQRTVWEALHLSAAEGVLRWPSDGHKGFLPEAIGPSPGST